MRITCVILNYNDSDTTIELLKRIVYYKTLSYIVVIDNNSTDDSFDRLSKYANDKIHVIKSDKNGGYGYGNNFGVRYSYYELKADQIIIANPDVEFSNKCVQEMSDVLFREERCAVVCPRSSTPQNIPRKSAAWRIPTALEYLFIASALAIRISRTIFYDAKYYEGQQYCFVDCVEGSLLMVDAKIMMEYGMYDEDIFLYCEDTVLGYKLKKSGYRTILMPNNAYVHHHSVSIDKSYPLIVEKQRLLHASKLTVFKKYYGLNKVQIIFVKAFFAYCSLEARCIALFKKIV